MDKINPYLLALLSGALMAFAYRIPGAWFVSFVALVPLLTAVYCAKNAAGAARMGFLAGLLVTGTATSWFFAVLPLSATFGVLVPLYGVVFVTFSWILVVAVLALPLALFAVVARELPPKNPLDVFSLAVLYAGCEYLRLYTFNLLTMDPGASNPAFFSAGSIAWPLLDSASWGQIAAFGGLYPLGVVVVGINVLFYILLERTTRRRALLALLAVSIVIVSLVPVAGIRARFSTDMRVPTRVAIVSLAHDRTEPTNVWRVREAEELQSFVHDASSLGADLIILPEGSQLFIPFAPHTVGEYLSATSSTTVIDSGTIRVRSGERPIRAFANTRTDNHAVRDKKVLTPQGEYLPFLFRSLLHVFGAYAAEERFDAGRMFSPGNGDGRAVSAGPIHASVLFCLEVMYPGLSARLAHEQGSNLIAVTASHSVFGESTSLERDTMRFAKLQAIEAGLPLATSKLHGVAYVLDSYGQIIARVGDGTHTEWKVVTIPVVSR